METLTARGAWPTFSLLFFANAPAEAEIGKFDLFRASSRFADEHDFEAVWIPERHFHAFGGIFPNPALMAVVLAESTRRIRIRAGSVVMPLHHPIRVAEEWAVVDNLSNGRVDLGFARGWNPNDFVIAPEHWNERHRVTVEGIEAVRKLWRGEPYEGGNGEGRHVSLRVHPLPLQKDLNVWFTCSGGPERFEEAGRAGFNVVTALLFQKVDELAAQDGLATGRPDARPAMRVRAGSRSCCTPTLELMKPPPRKPCASPFKRYLESSADLWQVGDARLQGSVGPQEGGHARVRVRALLPADRPDGLGGILRPHGPGRARGRRGRNRLPDRFRAAIPDDHGWVGAP